MSGLLDNCLELIQIKCLNLLFLLGENYNFLIIIVLYLKKIIF